MTDDERARLGRMEAKLDQLSTTLADVAAVAAAVSERNRRLDADMAASDAQHQSIIDRLMALEHHRARQDGIHTALGALWAGIVAAPGILSLAYHALRPE